MKSGKVRISDFENRVRTLNKDYESLAFFYATRQHLRSVNLNAKDGANCSSIVNMKGLVINLD